MTIEARLQEHVLALVLEAKPDIHSPYGLYGNPPMWNVLDLGDGRAMAARPAATQRRTGYQWEQVDGVSIGWHVGGKWTDDQHLSMTWDHFAENFFLPSITGGATVSAGLDAVLSEKDKAELQVIQLRSKGEEVPAEAHSDDFMVEVILDARPFLASASEKELLELRGIDWRGDYAADAVYHAAEAEGDGQAAVLASYLAKRPTMPNGDTVGFEVVCDEEKMMAWLKAHRPDAYAAVAAAEIQSKYDIEGSELDDLVHDHASQIGSAANNASGAAFAALIGCDPSVLDRTDSDEMAHDAASIIASNVNNAGVDSQLRFLLLQGLTADEIEDELNTESPAP